jgi:hypothetical protein
MRGQNIVLLGIGLGKAAQFLRKKIKLHLFLHYSTVGRYESKERLGEVRILGSRSVKFGTLLMQQTMHSVQNTLVQAAALSVFQ